MSRLSRLAPLLALPLLLLLRPAAADDDGDFRKYFPWEMNICKVKDPRINECFRDSANLMIQYLVPGMKKLGALPLDPLRIPYLALEKDNTVMPSLSFNVSNTVHRGWKQASVINATANPCANEFRLRILFPRYKYTGDYEVSGKMLDIPLMGKGDFAITFLNLSFHVRMRGHLERRHRNNKRYLRVDHLAQRSVIGDAHFEVHNLFGHDLLSNVTNSLLNWNSKAICRAAEPVMDRIFGDMHRDLIQRIFDKVPYDSFFPDLRKCGPQRTEVHVTPKPPPTPPPAPVLEPAIPVTPAADDDEDDDDDDDVDDLVYEDDDDDDDEEDDEDDDEKDNPAPPAGPQKLPPPAVPTGYQTVLQALLSGKFG